MKSRAFVRDHVVPAGGVLVRRSGDHHVYRLPNGRHVSVPMGGSQSDASPGLIRELRRALACPPLERKQK